MSPLEGKVAVVSGSSLGIGAAIARELSSQGASIVINYPNSSEKENAERVLRSLSKASTSIAVEADLSTVEGPRLLGSAAAQKFGKVDILVNCVGIFVMAFLDDPDEAKVDAAWERVMNLNGRGTYLLTREILKILSPENSRIINISSSTSRTPPPGTVFYAGSKALIESFTRSWATELPRKYGCTVNAIVPSPIATETFLASPQHVQQLVKPVIDRTPVGSRLGKPEEIAWMVAALCDEKASWVNGASIVVSGGNQLS